MSRYRTLLVVAGLGIALSVTLGTSGMSATEADRPVEIAVVDDEHAYVGFEQEATEINDGTATLEITVTNQHPTGPPLRGSTVTVDGHTTELTKNTQNSNIPPGQSRTRTFEGVSCGSSITINADGPNVKITVDRTVRCG